MRALFVACFAVLVVLSLVAWQLVPPIDDQGKTRLVWSTDPNPVRQAQVDLFNKLNPDLHLVIDPNNTDQQKVIVQSQGGVGPDLFDCYATEQLEAFVLTGIAWDVTDELVSRDINVQSMVWPVTLSSFIYHDRVYGFPRNFGTNALWYNKNVFDEAGVPYPKEGWTWDDLIETAKKLTKRDKTGRPVRFGLYWDFNTTAELILQFGGRQFTPDGTKCIIDSPEAAEAVQLSRDLMYKHKVAPSPVDEAALTTQGGWGSGGMTWLMKGQVAMAYGGRWWLNLMRSETAKGLRLGCIPLPKSKVDTVIGYGGITCINRHSPRRGKALRFLLFLMSKPYNELLNDQADGMSAIREYCLTERFLHNPEHPEEDYNHVWLSLIQIAQPAEISPFLRGNEMAPLRNQLDLIKGNLKPVKQALRDAARDTNERILRNVRTSPRLRDLYEELTGRRP